jgi:cobalt/nickel transport system permease protein
MMGHGGVTAIGLNTLILGTAATIAYLSYRWLVSGFRAPVALAIAAGSGQAAAGVLWLAVVAVALRPTVPHADAAHRTEWIGALALPLWGVGTLVEAAVAYGIARFLARVHPALLPPPYGGIVPVAPVREGG